MVLRRQDASGIGPFRAVVFDFDGTLADSYAAITASVNHARAAHGLPPLSEPEVRRHVGRGPAHLLRETVPGGDVEADVGLYRAHHPSVLRSGTHILPGVADTLAALWNAGYRLGVCSNKLGPFTRQLLDYLALDRFFRVVVGPEDAPRPKPAPDMLQTALQRLDVIPAEALYVGDMVVDIETARSAGVTVWVIPTGSEERSALEAGQPDRLLGAFAEIATLLVPAGLSGLPGR
jgi:phosphoglycolate phosphatase